MIQTIVISDIEFLDEQDRKDIEKEIKNSFREVNVFGEYYRKEAKKDLIEFLDKLILSYE